MISRFILYLTLACSAGSFFIHANENAEKIFTSIYDQGAWGKDEKGQGISGSGSLVENASLYMKFLEDFVKANEIKTIVDVGCGDWSFSRYINWNSARYLGVDVVKSVIERNQSAFTSPTVTFVQADTLNTPLPAADLLICKDVLQHLNNEDVKVFLGQLSHFKHCLITNDVDPQTFSSLNQDITRGDYRNLDLTKPPFNLKGVKILNFRSGYVFKQVLYISNPVS